MPSDTFAPGWFRAPSAIRICGPRRAARSTCAHSTGLLFSTRAHPAEKRAASATRSLALSRLPWPVRMSSTAFLLMNLRSTY